MPHESARSLHANARAGPHAILSALNRLAVAGPAKRDWVVAPLVRLEDASERVRRALEEGWFPIALGGEPAVGTAVAEGVRKVYGNAEVLRLGARPRGRRPVHFSCDVGVLEAGLMPAVAVPRPDGMSWRSAMRALDAVFARARVVGADVTGLCPIPEFRAPEVVAARLVMEIVRRIAR